MTEEDARSWIADRFGGASVDRLERFVALLAEESKRQNLVAASTLPSVWGRHIVDSAQLVPLSTDMPANWCDVGSGAGLPGVVIAVLSHSDVWLVEPRARRATFLSVVVDALELPNAHVVKARVEALRSAAPMDVITARAVAGLSHLFSLCEHLTAPATRFILPKGRSGLHELALARAEWQGTFHVEQSISDTESTIIIADGVTRRCSASR